MNLKKKIISNKIVSISTSISSYLILIFQYVPCTTVWFGIMSIPIISYIFLFLQNPNILMHDFLFFFGTPGSYIAICGFIFYIYSLIFQLTHRKQLTTRGPYKLIRHPQYVALIIMTFGLTLIAFQTSPLFEFNFYNVDPYSLLLLIWVGEVLAYIILAKIEEIALRKKYRDEYIKYKNYVGFMLPSIKLGNRDFKDSMKKEKML